MVVHAASPLLGWRVRQYQAFGGIVMRKLSRWVVLVLVLAVALTAGPTTILAGRDGRGADDRGPQGRGLGQFGDVSPEFWAYRDIVMMQVKEVFRGYGDGNFGPGDSVTRIQLVSLALRIMGLEDDAEAMGEEAAATYLAGVFDDHNTVPDWAREALAYSHQNGYLFGLCYQEQTRFRPNDPAIRLEVVVTLLEAMGHGEAAAALATAPISAPDADTVPAWAHGYIALAIDMGLLRGDEDGNLNLYDNVRRSEMAALLARADDQVDSPADDAVLEGELVSVVTGDSPSITLLVEAEELEDYDEADDDEDEGDEDEGDEDEGDEGEDGADDETLVTVTYPVSPDALIFLRGHEATLADLAPGDEVHVRLDEGLVVLIDARVEMEEVEGTFVSATYDGEALASVTIVVGDRDDDDDEDEGEDDEDEGEDDEDAAADAPADGSEVTYAVAGDAVIWFRGDKDSDVTLREGDVLELKLIHDQVVIIVLDERYEVKGELECTLTAVGEGTITVEVTEIDWEEGEPADGIAIGAEVTLTLADDVEIRHRGDDILLADLVVGSELELKLEDGLVTRLVVEELPGEDDDDEDDDD